MLLELHVKNLALIEQADVEFSEGLNILTGETGAGKSIIIGSVNLALGQKASKDMIRSGAEYAYVELIFQAEEDKIAALTALDVYPDENGLLIITRKIMAARSVSKINDETVTAAKLKAAHRHPWSARASVSAPCIKASGDSGYLCKNPDQPNQRRNIRTVPPV
jgi:DNA repair protein RecN (Recombination protein N)